MVENKYKFGTLLLLTNAILGIISSFVLYSTKELFRALEIEYFIFKIIMYMVLMGQI